MDEQTAKKIGEKWSKHVHDQNLSKKKLRWWESEFIIGEINRVVCGETVQGRSQGLINEVIKLLPDSLPLEKGISVGCGSGKKEMNLIKQNIVKSFDLFELSEAMIEKGRVLAEELGVADKVNFIRDDAFKLITGQELYDIVHWGDALHHMLDVYDGVAWSYKVLKKGGLFYMDDYVGASRFQWSDKSLEIASKMRETFASTKYLSNPYAPEKFLSTVLSRPNVTKMIEDDPSEAADSGRILDAVQKYFPDARIKITGGVIYHLGLSDMINNFDENKAEDQLLLKLLMLIDELCVDLGETHYGTALAIKPN